MAQVRIIKKKKHSKDNNFTPKEKHIRVHQRNTPEWIDNKSKTTLNLGLRAHKQYKKKDKSKINGCTM